MNAALLVISSLAVGGDVVPAGGIMPAGWAEAPLVGPGCGTCGPVAPSCGCGKESFFDKVKARFAPKGHCGCECEKHRPALFERLKSWGGKKHSCDCAVAAPCVTPGAPVAPPAPVVPPKDMPKPIPKSDAPKAKTSSLDPTPTAPVVPSAPAASAPKPSDAITLPQVPLAPIPSKPVVNSPY